MYRNILRNANEFGTKISDIKNPLSVFVYQKFLLVYSLGKLKQILKMWANLTLTYFFFIHQSKQPLRQSIVSLCLSNQRLRQSSHQTSYDRLEQTKIKLIKKSFCGIIKIGNLFLILHLGTLEDTQPYSLSGQRYGLVGYSAIPTEWHEQALVFF